MPLTGAARTTGTPAMTLPSERPSIPCSTLDEITYDALLHEIGWHEVMRLEVAPGEGTKPNWRPSAGR